MKRSSAFERRPSGSALSKIERQTEQNDRQQVIEALEDSESPFSQWYKEINENISVYDSTDPTGSIELKEEIKPDLWADDIKKAKEQGKSRRPQFENVKPDESKSRGAERYEKEEDLKDCEKALVVQMLQGLPDIEKVERVKKMGENGDGTFLKKGLDKLDDSPDYIISIKDKGEVAVSIRENRYEDLDYRVLDNKTFLYNDKKIEVAELGINYKIWDMITAEINNKLNENPSAEIDLIAIRDDIIGRFEFATNYSYVEIADLNTKLTKKKKKSVRRPFIRIEDQKEQRLN